MKLLFFVSLFLCACGEAGQIITFEPSIKPHVDFYLMNKQAILGRGADRVVTVSLSSEDHGREIGHCIVTRRRGGSLTFQVRVYAKFWFAASYPQREQLIMHELGHCDLGLDHSDDKHDIMYKYQLREWYYIENRSFLVNKLFLP
jgi:hypothetical protein